MIDASLFSVTRKIFMILVCTALASCATTQRSSSGAGGQTAAPISEAGVGTQEGATADAATKSLQPSADNPGSALSPAGKPATSSTERSGAGATGQPKTASANDGAEEAQLKRQLAEQEAEISKLRTTQETEAAQREQQQAAQGGDANGSSPGGKVAAPAAVTPEQVGKPETAAAHRDDDIVIFPAGEKSGQAAVESLAPAPAADARSIFFEYDQSTIPKQYDTMLLQNAAYLKASPRVSFEVQGNCDERGSREYNLALGARRAQAVKRALELAGADGGRIQVVSFGAEKPIANGKDEESYSKNRRVDIVY